MIETLEDALDYLEQHDKIDGLYNNQQVDGLDYDYNINQEVS